MNFSRALEELKAGSKIARTGWNGKGMFLLYVSGTPACKVGEGTPYYRALRPEITDQTMVDINPHIDMMTATGEMQPGWLASQTDMLADDWVIIE